MKSLFFVLSLLALITTSMNASADWGPFHGGPGWGHGPGHGGPGYPPPPPPPPGWGPGHGGPGYPPPPGWGPGHGGPGHGYPPPRQQYVQCSSGGYSLSYCRVPGYVQSAQIVRQDSMAACNLGESWGYQNDSIWVDRGCRGTFLVYLY